MPENNETSWGGTILMLIVATTLIAYSTSQNLVSEKQQAEIVNTISEKVTQDITKKLDQNLIKPSKYPDYDSLEGLKKLDLIKNFTSWTPNSKTESNKMIKKIIVEEGTLSKGYIYIKASLNNKALSKWESIYVMLNDVGGHIFRPKSLAVPESEKTELLFALDELYYLPKIPYSEQKTPNIADWFQLFKDKSKVSVTAFISSLKPAVIEELTFFYECSDGSECLLKTE